MLTCTARSKLPLRQAMNRARAQVRLCRKARVTGVAFFDFNHGQTRSGPKRDRAPPDSPVRLSERLAIPSEYASAIRSFLIRIGVCLPQ